MVFHAHRRSGTRGLRSVSSKSQWSAQARAHLSPRAACGAGASLCQRGRERLARHGSGNSRFIFRHVVVVPGAKTSYHQELSEEWYDVLSECRSCGRGARVCGPGPRAARSKVVAPHRCRRAPEPHGRRHMNNGVIEALRRRRSRVAGCRRVGAPPATCAARRGSRQLVGFDVGATSQRRGLSPAGAYLGWRHAHVRRRTGIDVGPHLWDTRDRRRFGHEEQAERHEYVRDGVPRPDPARGLADARSSRARRRWASAAHVLRGAGAARSTQRRDKICVAAVMPRGDVAEFGAGSSVSAFERERLFYHRRHRVAAITIAVSAAGHLRRAARSSGPLHSTRARLLSVLQR